MRNRSLLPLVAIFLPTFALAQVGTIPPASSGGGGGSGTVTSVDTGCGLSGGTITGAGTIVSRYAANAQTGTTYTVLTGNCGKVVTFSNAAAIAVTLPQAGSGFEDGWFFIAKNIGAGDVTITPTTSTISGTTAITISTGEWALITSNGTNYEAETNHITVDSALSITRSRTSQQIGAGASVVTLTGSQTLTNKTLTSPTLTTPTLGVASATSVNKMAITAPATSSTLAVADGKTLTASNTLTFTGTDSSSVAFGAGGTVTYTIASGTKALDTDAIASGACDTLATTTATGTASTDVVTFTANADITGVTGYAPVTTGGLAIYVWPTTNTINWKVCNPTSSSITPGAVTLNYRVTR